MTFLLCDPGWCVHRSDVQNKWDNSTHHSPYRVKTRYALQLDEVIISVLTRFTRFPQSQAKRSTLRETLYCSHLDNHER